MRPIADTEVVERLARLEEQVKGVNSILVERDKQVGIALTSIEKATTKAEEAQQRVNQTQNEFRGALKDQAGLLATKDELVSMSRQAVTMGEAIGLRIDTISEAMGIRMSALENKSAASTARVEGKERGGQPLMSIGMMILSALTAAIVAYLMRAKP